jgi:hypothetical protein
MATAWEHQFKYAVAQIQHTSVGEGLVWDHDFGDCYLGPVGIIRGLGETQLHPLALIGQPASGLLVSMNRHVSNDFPERGIAERVVPVPVTVHYVGHGPDAESIQVRKHVASGCTRAMCVHHN